MKAARVLQQLIGEYLETANSPEEQREVEIGVQIQLLCYQAGLGEDPASCLDEIDELAKQLVLMHQSPNRPLRLQLMGPDGLFDSPVLHSRDVAAPLPAWI